MNDGFDGFEIAHGTVVDPHEHCGILHEIRQRPAELREKQKDSGEGKVGTHRQNTQRTVDAVQVVERLVTVELSLRDPNDIKDTVVEEYGG